MSGEVAISLVLSKAWQEGQTTEWGGPPQPQIFYLLWQTYIGHGWHVCDISQYTPMHSVSCRLGVGALHGVDSECLFRLILLPAAVSPLGSPGAAGASVEGAASEPCGEEVGTPPEERTPRY